MAKAIVATLRDPDGGAESEGRERHRMALEALDEIDAFCSVLKRCAADHEGSELGLFVRGFSARVHQLSEIAKGGLSGEAGFISVQEMRKELYDW